MFFCRIQRAPLVVGQTTILPVNPGSDLSSRKQNAVPIQNSTTITPVVATTKSSLREFRKHKLKRSSMISSSASVLTTSSSVMSYSGKLNTIPPQRQVEGRKFPIVQNVEDLIPSKKPKHLKGTTNNPVSTSSSLNLPKGLTITEINHMSRKQGSNFPAPRSEQDKNNSVCEIQMLPVASPYHQYLKLKPNVNNSQPPISTGHPGLPNGLLRVASMQQSGSGLPQVATKVVPKDLKSQLALSRIGLPNSNNSADIGKSKSGLNKQRPEGHHLCLKPPPVKPSQPIPYEVMRQDGVKIMPVGSKPKTSPSIMKHPKNNNSSKKPSGNGQKNSNNKSSPNSSRSSSRNSSLSPRERSGSASKGSGNNNGSSVFNKSGKPGSPKSTTKKKIQPNLPMVPWAIRNNNGVPKVCNGWSWVGEGTEDRVFLNVSDVHLKI